MRPIGLLGRIVGASAVLALVVGVLFAILLAAIGELRAASRDARASQELVTAANALQRQVLDLETGVRGYLITREQGYLEPFNAARADAPVQARELVRQAERRDPSQAGRAQAIDRELRDYLRDFAVPLIRDVEGRQATDAAAAASEGKRRLDAMRAQFAAFLAVEERTVERRRQAAEDSARNAVLLGIAALVVSVLLVLAFAGYLTRSTLAPIRRVAAGAQRLAAGDLRSRVDERGAAEAGELGRSFNVMAGALERQQGELEEANRELAVQGERLAATVDELEGEKAQIEVLHRFGQRLTEEVEPEPLAAVVLAELCEIADAQVGALYGRARDERAPGGASLLATRGLDPAHLPPQLEPGRGLAGRALVEHRAVTARFDEVELSVPAWGSQVRLRAETHLPLRQSDREVGVVSLGRVADRPFGADEVDTLELLAAQAAIALSNARALQLARHQARVNRLVIDTARDAFYAVDEEGLVRQWNPAATALLGYRREEALGLRADDLLAVPPETGGPVEAVARHRDGHEIHVEIVVSPLESEGRWTFNVFLRDITARKRAERHEGAQNAVNRALAEAASLEEAEARVLEALGRALDWELGAFWRIDAAAGELRLRCTWGVDEQAARELEARSREVTFPRGAPLPGRVWETGDVEWVSDTLSLPGFQRAALLSRRGLRSAIALPVVGGGRTLGVVELFAAERPAPDETLLSLLAAVGQQIGQYVERKESEREAERLKDQFFALVSHELRTPLTSIIGYLELVLEDGDGLGVRDRRFLTVVDRNARRLLRLVGDLLFVAHIEAGRLSLEVGRVDLTDLTDEAVEAARPRAEARDLRLEANTEAVPTLAGDRDRLGQVLDNLIGNAIKFTPEGGRIEVRLRTEATRAVVEVTDSGVGIPAEEQERLFERFFRASTATDRAIPGVGLGLTIAKAIVDAHGGRISVRSVTGEGTTFRVTIPLDRPPDRAPEAAGVPGGVPL